MENNLLSGKAKADFEKYIEQLEVAPYVAMLDLIPKCYLTALIIEWLDSVGIYVFPDVSTYDGNIDCFDWSIRFKEKTTVYTSYDNSEKKYDFSSRQEATNQAIIKANEIYNNGK